MISIKDFSKIFDDYSAVSSLSVDIESGNVFGLLGSNGSGKSTLLRSIAGIYEPDNGNITVDGIDVFENTDFKNDMFFVSDTPYFFEQSTINDMANFYRQFYSNWDEDIFKRMCEVFPLDTNKRISRFSKGMKRQAEIILALSCSPKYLLLDEAFDGLDAVMRTVLKKLILEKIVDRQMTVIVSSHNISEFENLCDSILVLHMGKKILCKTKDELSQFITKAQIAFNLPPSPEMFSNLDVISYESRGNLATVIVRGNISETETKLKKLNPIFLDILPTSLDEVFLYEMEANGYDSEYIG